MADATHVPPEDQDLRGSVLRNLGAAIGLIVLVAAVFGGIGMLGRADTPTPLAADDEQDADVEPTGEPTPEPTDDVDPEPTEEPDATEDDASTDADEATEDDEADEDEVADPEPVEEEADEPDDDATGSPAIAPGDITVQVLDGYKTDGGAAARSLAASLREDGYQVVAENQALSYERTTVLWTEGNEAAARQVAAAIGAAEVREQPGNLSTAVDVHVVVGADRG